MIRYSVFLMGNQILCIINTTSTILKMVIKSNFVKYFDFLANGTFFMKILYFLLNVTFFSKFHIFWSNVLFLLEC